MLNISLVGNIPGIAAGMFPSAQTDAWLNEIAVRAMPLNKVVEPIVTLLTSYLLDGGKDLVDQFGDQAPSLAN